MKYFFLSDSWTTGRVWEFGGLWNEVARRRKPYVQKQSLCIHENGEVLWLFQAEDSILMIEVTPKAPACTPTPIGQVMLKRLLSAEQVIEKLCEENVFQPHWHEQATNAEHAPSWRHTISETASNQEPQIALKRENNPQKNNPLNAN